MKSNTVKYIIKVTPTFSQRLGFGVISMFGGAIGGIAGVYILAYRLAMECKKDKEDKKDKKDKKDKEDKKVSDIKDFINRVKKEESEKE